MLKIDRELLDSYDGSTYRKSRESAPEPEVATGKPESKRGFLSDAIASMGGQTVGMAGDVAKWATQGENTFSEWAHEKEKAFDADRSAKLRAQADEFNAIVSDPDLDWTDALAFIAKNPYFAAQTAIGSLPTMVLGGGFGGAAVKGTVATAKLAGLAGKGYQAGRAVTAAGAGIGEGIPMGAGVYDETGSNAAALAATALGVGTAFIPGNVETMIARKVAGGSATDQALDTGTGLLLRSGAGYAVGRGLATGAKEAGGEFFQETGEALITQGGKGEDFNLREASKQGVLGAVAGAATGVALHPVVGEGPKLDELASAKKVFESALSAVQQDHLNLEAAAVAKVAGATVERIQAELDIINTDVGKTTPLQKLTLAEKLANEQLLRTGTPEAQATYTAAKTAADAERVRLNPQSTPTQKVAAELTAAAASDPDNKPLQDEAATATGQVLAESIGVEGANRIIDTAHAGAVQTMNSATTPEGVLAGFERAENVSALRLPVAGVANVATGVARVARGQEAEASHTSDETDEVVTPEQAAKRASEAGVQQEKEKLATLKVQSEESKLAQEREKLGLPTIDAKAGKAFSLSRAPEATGGVDDVAPTRLEALIESREPTSDLPTSSADLVAEAEPSVPQRRTQTTVAEAERRLRTLLQADGDSQQRIEETVANFRREAATGDIAGVESLARGFEQRNDHRPAEFLRALLDEREAAQEIQTNIQESEQAAATPAERARAELISYLVGQGRTQERATQLADALASQSVGSLHASVSSPASAPAVAAYARELLAARPTAAPTPTTDHVREAKQAMLDAGYNQPAVEAMHMMSRPELQYAMNDLRAKPEKRAYAREIMEDFNFNPALNRAQFNTRETELATAVSQLAQTSGRTEQGIIDALASRTTEELTNIINNPAAQHAREQHRAARERAVAFKNNTHLGNVDQFIPTARVSPPQRQVQTAVQHEAQRNNVRQVEENFTTRARAALNNGVLDKLGEFWTTVMGGQNQRVLDFNAADLANVARTIGGLPQDKLNELKDRYNAELNQRARQWSLDNNQGVLTTLVDPIESITKHGRSVEINVYGLGRHGANPYKVATRDTGSMTVNSDGHFTSVSLDDAPGSAELGYRLGAEIDRMAGMTAGADAILSTNNRMRRQMQSVYHDTLPGFGPGHVSPLTTSGTESPQGVPPSIWNAATPIQRVGLNILRAAHSVTEGRTGGVQTAAAFLENLQYNAQKQIVAVTEPLDPRGFPKGTVVTDAELDRKLAETDPTVGASARGRTASGGVGTDTAKLAILTNTLLAKIENDPSATIPAAWATRAKQIGREIGGWMFSEAATTGATGVTQEAAEARVRAMVGDKAAKLLLDSGLVSFVQTGEDLTGDTFSDANGKVQGATMPDGKIVLVLGNLSESTIDGVLSHEALHSTLKTLLGEDAHNAIMSQLETMLKAGEGAQWLKDAEARVPPNTDPAQRLEEIAAYAVELEVRGGARGNPLVRWARDFMSALRTAIIQNKALPEALRTWAMKNIQPADLTRLAVAGLKRAAVGEGAGVRQSQRRDFGAEINTLMEEHRAPGTTNERRAEINEELRTARQFQRAERDASFEQASARNPRYSVAEEDAVLHTPVADALPQEINVLAGNQRGGWARFENHVRTAIQDKNVGIRRLQQIARIGSENIRMDTIGALDRLGSKLMTQQRLLVAEPMAKMENILTRAGFTPEEGRTSLDELLIAMHVKEYNEHTAELNPTQFDHDENPGSGIKDAEAAATIQRLTGKGDAKAKALEAARLEYRKMIADLQSFAVERGLETQTTIDNWNKKFPNYTPFNRELDIDENLSIGTVPGSQGFSLRSGIARRAMGSAKDIVSPLASSMLWGMKTTTRGENAIVSRTMFEFAKAFVMKVDGKALWRVDVVPSSRTTKLVNVYQVPTAKGGMSPEFYNREKAQAYADRQQGEWEKLNPDANPDTSGIMVQRPYGDEPQTRVVIAPDPNYMNAPNVMVVPIDGVNHMIEFDKHSPDAMAIVEAFKGKATSGNSAQTINKMLTPARMFSRWVMATSTGFNPIFAFFNAARDVQAAAINAGADKIPGWTAGDSAKIATGLPAAWHGIAKQLRAEFNQLHGNEYTAPAPEAGSIAEWMERMVAAGGATGIANSVTDIESSETQLRRLYGQEALDKMTGKDVPTDWLSRMDRAFVKVGDTFHRLGEGETRAKGGAFVSKQILARIGRFNQSAELATRTLVFKRATELYLKDGHDLETAEKMAADISKNISTNFNRRGNFTNVVNQLVPFFNAATQGTARLAETLFVKETYEVTKDGKLVLDQRTKLTPYGKTVMTSLASLGTLQSMLLLAAGYDDDEVPKHIKDRAFVIPGLNGSYFAIPMPHGFNLLVNGGRELSDALVQGMMGNGRKALSHLADGTWGQIGALNPLGNAGNTVTDLLPAIADPFVSLAMNQDAFGRPIAKENLNPMAPMPGFKRAKEGATGFSKAVAEGLNAITLGNQDKPGMLSPTPDQIDFLMGYIGGGVGREVAKTVQSGTALGQDLLSIEREQLPTNRVPLWGRIYGDTTEPMVTNQKVFNITKELNILQAQYKGMMERGEKEEARAFRAEHPELALQDDFAKFSRGGSKQKKERVKLREEGEVGKINTMAEKKETKAQELLRRYEELLPE